MRQLFVCTKCDGISTFATAQWLPLNERNIYSFTCAAGHTTMSELHGQKFEFLADVAVQAIVDGYYRDAIASFAASLERFYEHYVTVISLHSGRYDAFRNTWQREMKRSSERQLGMYCGMYILENNTPAPVLSQAMTELRNNVVHRGHLPSREDAMKFGQAVFSLVQPIFWDMHARYRAAQSDVRKLEDVEVDKLRAAGVEVALNVVPMPFEQGERNGRPDPDIGAIVEYKRRWLSLKKISDEQRPQPPLT